MPNLKDEVIVAIDTSPGPDPPPDSAVRTLGRLFASLGGDQRGSYPRVNIVLTLLSYAKPSPVRLLAESLSLSVSATSQHLKRLENDGIVKGRRAGQEILYSLDGCALYDIIPLMRQVFPSLFSPIDLTNKF